MFVSVFQVRELKLFSGFSWHVYFFRKMEEVAYCWYVISFYTHIFYNTEKSNIYLQIYFLYSSYELYHICFMFLCSQGQGSFLSHLIVFCGEASLFLYQLFEIYIILESGDDAVMEIHFKPPVHIHITVLQLLSEILL